MAVLSGTGAVAPESLSKQVCGCPVGTVADMIQMREATICLMVDMEGGREGRWGGVQMETRSTPNQYGV